MSHQEAQELLFRDGRFGRGLNHLPNGSRVRAGAASDSRPKLAPLFRLHTQGIHGDLKVFAALYPIAHSANKRERLLDCRSLISRAVKVTIPYRLIDHELYMWLCLAA